jgi:hypothetical protein
MQVEISLSDKLLTTIYRAFQKAQTEDKTFYVVRDGTGKPVIASEKKFRSLDCEREVAQCCPKWIKLYSRYGMCNINL